MDNKEKYGIVKTVATLVIGAGVDTVVTDVIESAAPAQMKPLMKILRKIGSLALGAYVANNVVKSVAEDISQLESGVTGALEAAKAEAAKIEADGQTDESPTEEPEAVFDI